MKKLILLSVLLTQTVFAQTTNINLSVGNKTVELGLTRTIESEIILGGSFALTNSKVIEDRANLIDAGSYLHKVNTNYTPSVFALMGGKFDNLSIVTKVGSSYINQDIKKINSKEDYHKDSKVLYLAVGVDVMYQISDVIGIGASFDNVNSLMLGINYKIN